MKRCDYCGRDNEDGLTHCGGCGLPLVTFAPVQATAERLPRVLNVGIAGAVLVVWLAAQLAAGVGSGLVIGVVAGFQAHGGVRDTSALISRMMPAVMASSYILGGIAALAFAVCLVPNQIRDRSGAWVWGPWSAIAPAIGLGVAIAFAFEIIMSFFRYHVPRTTGPLDRMVLQPGIPRVTWVAMSVLFAPLIEEPLFRGIVYGGCRKSLGPLWAALLVTALFVLAHLPRLELFPMATLAITALALATLWCRLRWQAIGPAIAVHIGYNGVVTFITLLGVMYQPRM